VSKETKEFRAPLGFKAPQVVLWVRPEPKVRRDLRVVAEEEAEILVQRDQRESKVRRVLQVAAGEAAEIQVQRVLQVVVVQLVQRVPLGLPALHRP